MQFLNRNKDRKQDKTETVRPGQRDHQATRRQDLLDWFDRPLGRSLQGLEASHLRQILPSLYGMVAIQLGHIGKLNLMDACVAPARILIDEDIKPIEHGERVIMGAQADALPLDAKSVDVAILPHTLDFAEDPHAILREVDRVLSPEGHVVIMGFNPLSLWGLWRLGTFFHRRTRRRLPWCAKFVGLPRINDWLSLLGFERMQCEMLFHRPPIKREGVMDKLFFMERLGRRWWPRVGAIYMIVARKSVIGMTPLKPAWKKRKRLISGLAEPAAKVIYPSVPQWRFRRGG
ncbi:MAG: methyltransferase domain-containing protein [Gammaproteobacteria bacterium]|nr:MAG: methyltransferase domain-containing protein [Gammaproteobacteria bacterium]